MPEFPVIAIRSVELGVTDLARAEKFYRDVWGLRVADRQDGIVYLRATGTDHHVLALRPHCTAEILSVSFRVNDAAVVEQIAARTEGAGGIVIAPSAPNPEPDGGWVMKIATPEGYILLFH